MDRVLRNTNCIRSVRYRPFRQQIFGIVQFGSSDVPGGCDQILQMRREVTAGFPDQVDLRRQKARYRPFHDIAAFFQYMIQKKSRGCVGCHQLLDGCQLIGADNDIRFQMMGFIILIDAVVKESIFRQHGQRQLIQVVGCYGIFLSQGMHDGQIQADVDMTQCYMTDARREWSVSGDNGRIQGVIHDFGTVGQRTILHDLDMGAGRTGIEGSKEICEDKGTAHGRKTKGQCSVGCRHMLHIGCQLLGLFQKLICLIQEVATLRSQFQTAAAPGEQTDTEFTLQFLDRIGQTGLGDMEFGRCPCDIVVFADRLKVFQLYKCHGNLSIIMYALRNGGIIGRNEVVDRKTLL